MDRGTSLRVSLLTEAEVSGGDAPLAVVPVVEQEEQPAHCWSAGITKLGRHRPTSRAFYARAIQYFPSSPCS